MSTSKARNNIALQMYCSRHARSLGLPGYTAFCGFCEECFRVISSRHGQNGVLLPAFITSKNSSQRSPNAAKPRNPNFWQLAGSTRENDQGIYAFVWSELRTNLMWRGSCSIIRCELCADSRKVRGTWAQRYMIPRFAPLDRRNASEPHGRTRSLTEFWEFNMSFTYLVEDAQLSTYSRPCLQQRSQVTACDHTLRRTLWL